MAGLVGVRPQFAVVMGFCASLAVSGCSRPNRTLSEISVSDVDGKFREMRAEYMYVGMYQVRL